MKKVQINKSRRLTSMFNTFNRIYFNNAVSIIEVGFAKRKSSTYATTVYYPDMRATLIALNPLLKGTHYEAILLHEMVHTLLSTTDYKYASGLLPFEEMVKRFEDLSNIISKKSKLKINYKLSSDMLPKVVQNELKVMKIKKNLKNVKLQKQLFI